MTEADMAALSILTELRSEMGLCQTCGYVATESLRFNEKSALLCRRCYVEEVTR